MIATDLIRKRLDDFRIELLRCTRAQDAWLLYRELGQIEDEAMELVTLAMRRHHELEAKEPRR